MIKFFRKIRYQLLKENRFSKYLFYAIGEIILVMIGILLAFQVSNWKEKQDGERIEKNLMENLNIEFRTNLSKLKESRAQYLETEKSIRMLMNFMLLSKKDLTTKNIDSLLAKAVDVYDYNPTENALKEILASGKMDLLRKEGLKPTLFEWSAEINEKEEAWMTLDDFNQNMVFPFLAKNASMKNIDRYSLMQWKEKSKFEVNYEKMFGDIEFENNLDNLGWAVVNYKSSLERLQLIIERLIILTDNPR